MSWSCSAPSTTGSFTRGALVGLLFTIPKIDALLPDSLISTTFPLQYHRAVHYTRALHGIDFRSLHFVDVRGTIQPNPYSTATVSASRNGEPRPIPGASAHFAYSTSLRRHHHEHSLCIALPPKLPPRVTVDGLWQRIVKFVTGRRSYDDGPENGHAPSSTETHKPLSESELIH
ncbi:hypothetical protein EDC04DRAFT_1676242 [Pisolithus marmoratus]|nr:hypothetical protein EDC04DRAFT_1676242 [Pisolithus marmoratus]